MIDYSEYKVWRKQGFRPAYALFICRYGFIQLTGMVFGFDDE